MHLHVETGLVVIAVACSIALLLAGDRKAALAALAASGIEALRAFGVLSLSISILRIDLVLAVVLAAAGVLAWVRASTKQAITAAALVAVIGGVQVLHIVTSR